MDEEKSRKAWINLGDVGLDPTLLEDSSFKMFQKDVLEAGSFSVSGSLASKRIENVKCA